MTIKAKKSKINLREKLAELLNFRQIRDRLDGLGLYLGKDRTGTAENLAVRGGASIDDLQLAEISAALGGTAVDVFVYDTRNDSDGGKWRERTSHTSWYNEELNTATRGGRREFPAVAVIVAEADKVTIYDGDDPDLPMWMVFNRNNSFIYDQPSSVTALNGKIVLGGYRSSSTQYSRVSINDFVADVNESINSTSLYKFSGIVNRNIANYSSYYTSSDVNYLILSGNSNDVAMTVLPNALIDTETGLPIPTIAVATDGGVSVIKDDGSVVDITSGGYNHIDITNNRIWVSRSDTDIIETGPFPDSDTSNASWRETSYNDSSSVPSLVGVSQAGMPVIQNYVGNNGGLTYISEEINNLSNSMVSYTTSSYNTGWMPGDIKLATLSDSTVETVGVDETANFISNGENWTGASGSTPPNDWAQLDSGHVGTYSLSDGKLTITEDNGIDYVIMSQAFDVVAGEKYTVTVRYKSGGTGGSARFFVGESWGSAELVRTQDTTSTEFVTKSITFSSQTSQTVYLGLGNYQGDGGSAIFDYARITKTGELISNGTFDNRALEWTLGSGWSVSGGIATHTGTSFTIIEPTTSIGLIEGEKYTYTIDKAGPGSVYFYYNGNSNYKELSGEGSFVGTFTAGSNTNIKIGTEGVGATVDNISVRLAEPDRSVNDNGLQIFGAIDKTPVAPGADLVAYSGFSADDYLMQPYNSDLDFGTGDFSIMGWVKVSDMASLTYSLVYRSAQAITGNYYHCSLNQGKLKFARNDGVSEDNITGSTDLDNNTWHHFCGVYEGGDLKIYVDGRADADKVTAVNIGSVDDSSAVLTLGTRPNSTQFLDGGSLALCRVSATAPTDRQIAKIYQDERQLFTDGAQATLYGISDAVTALAYDDKTELLHVGTSGGRSDFAGLRRINNTTIPVTTSISASNNLIAEQ